MTINSTLSPTIPIPYDDIRADALDAGVRGRFSRELSLPVPDAPSRTKILALMTRRMKVAEDVDLSKSVANFIYFSHPAYYVPL